MPYKFKLSQTSDSNYIIHLSNQTDTIYFKLHSLDTYSNRLIEYLAITDSTIELDKEYDLNEPDPQEDFNALIKRIAIDLDMQLMELSPTTKCSVEGKAVTYSVRDLTAHKFYWQGHTPYALFKCLSEDIIEIPYADNKDDFTFRFGKTAYHPNHGTNHAVRQFILTKKYLNFLKREGRPDIKNTAAKLSAEEIACLELGAFLFRSGRTNEVGWSGDATYGPRSAEIFNQLTLRTKLLAVHILQLLHCNLVSSYN